MIGMMEGLCAAAQPMHTMYGRAANISKLHIGLYHSQQKCGRELAAFLSGHSFLPFMNNMKWN
jgi:hypothetical protein